MTQYLCHRHFNHGDHAEEEHTHRRFFKVGHRDNGTNPVKDGDKTLSVDRQRFDHIDKVGGVGDQVIIRGE